MRRAVLLGLLALFSAAASAQAPDLSGTWKLREEASDLQASIAYAGLGGNAGIPKTLYVTQAKNGTLIVGSDMNTSHARTYEPGAASRAPLGGETATMTTQLVGATLVAEGHDAASQNGLRESLTRSNDGTTLTVEIVVTTKTGTSSSTLIYKAATVEPPCVAWPTPCKDFSANETP